MRTGGSTALGSHATSGFGQYSSYADIQALLRKSKLVMASTTCVSRGTFDLGA